jgi:hypothetical protein
MLRLRPFFCFLTLLLGSPCADAMEVSLPPEARPGAALAGDDDALLPARPLPSRVALAGQTLFTHSSRHDILRSYQTTPVGRRPAAGPSAALCGADLLYAFMSLQR